MMVLGPLNTMLVSNGSFRKIPHNSSRLMNRCTEKPGVMACYIAAMAIVLFASINAVASDKSDLGLPACEQIVGVNRHIEIGNTVSYTLEYLEKNNYRCDEFKGNAEEIISCSYRLDRRFEILLTVEEGTVTDIDTLYNGMECSYFNIMPADPRDTDDDPKKSK